MESNKPYRQKIKNEKKSKINSVSKEFDSRHSQHNSSHYKRLLRTIIVLTSLVSITPLVILALINFYQYQVAYNADIVYPITRQTSNLKHTLESFIEERLSALKLLVQENTFDDLNNYDKLFLTFHHLKNSFDGFVDLSVIDSKGNQHTYIGPYNLAGKNYRQQDWFNEVVIKGGFVSDVFMGFRGFPHFTIAVLKEEKDNNFFILRASINSDLLYEKILAQNLLTSTDVFLINHSGILQTNSQNCGNILKKCSIRVPPYSPKTEVIKMFNQSKSEVLLGYTYIENTPFILFEVTQTQSLMGNWFKTRNQLIIFLIVSIIIILIMITWGSRKLVNMIKESDFKTAKVLHEIEYTSKMASIGRLAAGVSHEINNPLAIINENAGMISDIMSATEVFPFKEKIIKSVNSILKSVDRCSRITHQLLGFAKRMDTKIEDIYIYELLTEVSGFVRREAVMNNIILNINSQDESLKIKTDRGLLQQVFLNIINNAIEAVKEGGNINIEYSAKDIEYLEVKIMDNGIGIPHKDMENIFEPFFTTKKEYGTGLGLSITYGIVQKLGGDIEVISNLNIGTTFIITLPFEHNMLEDAYGEN